MELKVWVEGIQRIVCGVTDKTTCQVRTSKESLIMEIFMRGKEGQKYTRRSRIPIFASMTEVNLTLLLCQSLKVKILEEN